MTFPKRPDTFTLIIIVLILIVIAIAGYLFYLLSGRSFIPLSLPSSSAVNLKVSQDSLFLTQPVTTLNNVQFVRASGNTIWVEMLGVYQSFSPINSTDITIPPPIEKKLTFKIEVPDSLVINRSGWVIPYVFTPPAPNVSVSLSLNDLKPGDLLTINTNSDLRLIDDKITASSITVNLPPNSIIGTVISISGTTIEVKATTVFNPLANSSSLLDKTYTVNVTSDTELSTLRNNQQTRLIVNDLKAGNIVTIYSLADTTKTTTFDAASIVVQPESTEQIVQPPLPPASSINQP